ncbi:MAG: hypothetical protein BroJett030_14330 [Alphaproteobacteria bacterium]|nr:MAG: hypothetical protein BroJett030_14330 [Alphaproteobacteria bacterium]
MDQMKLRRKMRLLLLPAMLSLAAAGGGPGAAQEPGGPRVDAADQNLLRLRGSDGAAIEVPVFPQDPFDDDPLPQRQPPAAEVEAPRIAPVDPADPDEGRAERAAAATADENVGDEETGDGVRVERVPPVEPGRSRVEEADPFAATGFRMGIWQVFTRIEQSIGYATNNSFSAEGGPGAFSQTDVNVEMRTDWARHEASIVAAAALRRSIGSDDDAIPDASIEGNLRLDLIDGLTGNLRAGYVYSTESLTSEALSSTVTDRPGIHDYGLGGELARTGGRLEMTLRGSADRTTYDDQRLADGSTQSQSDRNSTLYQLTSVVAYGPAPALKPFVHAGIGWRIFDEERDRNGEDRNSVLYDLRTGLRLDLGDKLKGEMAVGYLIEDFSAATLATKDAVTLNGAVDWSPQRDTTVSLSAATSFSGATIAGDNGSVDYTFGIEAVRRVRDNLAVNTSATYEISRFPTSGASEQTWTVGAGLEYWVSRYLALTADVEYQRFNGETAATSWDSTAVRVGVALQR